jgi:peptide chain release factor 3
MPWRVIRWVHPDDIGQAAIRDRKLPTGCRLATDAAGRTAALFNTDWELRYFTEKNPAVRLTRLPSVLQRVDNDGDVA